MERSYLNQGGVSVTDSKVVFKQRVNSDTFEELTFFVAHIASIKLEVKTIRPSQLPFVLMVLGGLFVAGGLIALLPATQNGTDISGPAASLILGAILFIIGIRLRRGNREREECTVILRTSGGDTKILKDVVSEGEFAKLMVEAVNRAILGQQVSNSS